MKNNVCRWYSGDDWTELPRRWLGDVITSRSRERVRHRRAAGTGS